MLFAFLEPYCWAARLEEPTHVASVASLVYADNRPEWQQISMALQHRRIKGWHIPPVEEERVGALQVIGRRANDPKGTSSSEIAKTTAEASRTPTPFRYFRDPPSREKRG
jgi:hypothetical protein